MVSLYTYKRFVTYTIQKPIIGNILRITIDEDYKEEVAVINIKDAWKTEIIVKNTLK